MFTTVLTLFFRISVSNLKVERKGVGGRKQGNAILFDESGALLGKVQMKGRGKNGAATEEY